MSLSHGAPTSGPESNRGFRIALWSLLGLTLVAIVGLAVASVLRSGGDREKPLPVLGEVPAFELTSSTGETVTRDDLAGAPYAVDFVFTRCVTSCPILTNRLRGVGEGLVEGEDFRRVSISVDPAHDTPAVLRAFREERSLPAAWWFLTGEPDAVLALVVDGFHLAVEPDTGNPADPIAHSTRIVLADGDHRIRGYYDGLDPEAVATLDRDLRRLAAESL